MNSPGKPLGAEAQETILADLECLLEEAFRRSGTLTVATEREFSIPPSLDALGIRLLTIVPLMTLRHRLGALFVGRANPEPLSSEEESLLSSVGANLAIGLENIRLQEELTRYAAELEASTARFRKIYDRTPVMMHSIGDQGRLVGVNDYWLEVLGYQRDEVLGRPSTDFLTDESRRHAQEVRLPEFLRTGVVKDIEYQMVRKDGDVIDVLLSATTSYDAEGHLLARMVDVTERKRAQHALHESEERFAGVFRSAIDAVVITEEDRTVTLFNPAAEAMFECAASEIVGRPLDRFLSPELRDAILESFEATRGEEGPSQYLWHPAGLKAVRENGEVVHVEASVSHYEASGRQLCALTLRDVNERRETEAALERLHGESRYLRDEIRTEHDFAEIVGASPELRKVLKDVETVAPTDSTVLISGETGTGKELVARAIHDLSARRGKPLIKVDCTTLPSTLIESELFGHEKGAFTGAATRRVGRFELADKGTIFLDEIGDLPLDMQAKLLRVLQEGEFERVGGAETLRVDVRVIAATNRDIDESVAEGRLRPDLYYRLNVFPIVIPPLRERKADISLLVSHFLDKHGRRMGKHIDGTSDSVLKALHRYDWPGNVRELDHLIERAVVLTEESTLEAGDWLPMRRSSGEDDRIRTLDEAQRAHILAALELTNWTVRGSEGAAEILGMKPSTLNSRMKKLGIKRLG